MSAQLLFNAGFTDIVSVVPPAAVLSENSKIPEKDKGKAPGKKNYRGEYAGYAWRAHKPTFEDAQLWDAEGNNVGLAAARFPGIDIDILDANLSAAVRAVVEQELGITLTRYGRRPKVLLMYRAAEPMKSFRHKYEHYLTGEQHLVEFLCEGNQYVVSGMHPDTGQPYELEDSLGAFGILGADALPEIGLDDVARVFIAIDAAMAYRGFEVINVSGSGVLASEANQDSLLAPSAEALHELVSQIPNDLPTREEWIAFGYAIKAAGSADPGAAYEAWADWCEKWGGGNDPGAVEHEWSKMKPPYRTGYDWLLARARYYGISTGGWEFGSAQAAPISLAELEAVIDEGLSTDPEVAASQQALAAAEPTPAAYSDSALSREFIEKFGHELFTIPDLRQVFQWNGKTWVLEHHLSHRVQRFLDDKADEARGVIEKAAKRDEVTMKLGSRRTRQSVLANVMESPVLRREASAVDARHDILNTPAGPYCLRTGQKLKPDPSLLLTRCTTVSPDFDKDCPVWRKFIGQAMLSDWPMVNYLQTFSGYTLTGRMDSQVFPFFRGAGTNGKSKFIEVQTRIMGTSKETGYATVASKDLLQARRGGHARDTRRDLAALVGRRLVITNETDAGSLWDEQLIKQITGGDEVNACKVHCEPFTYTPTYKLLVIGNHEPDLTGVGPAMTRRLQLVPWLYVPPVDDTELPAKLVKEYPAILAWMIEGARHWYESGLPSPEVMSNETNEYLEDQDITGQWLHDCVARGGEDDLVTTEALYASYAGWMSQHRHYVCGMMNFAKLTKARLLQMGARKTRTSEFRGYKKLRLLEPSEFSAVPNTVVPFPPGGKRGS